MSKTHKEHIQGGKGFIEDQRLFFDKLITEDWHTYLNLEWDLARQFDVNEILRRIPLPQKVLDIGCGCGYHDAIFARNIGIKNVIGIDYSSKSIDIANREYSHLKIKRFVADIFTNLDIIKEEGPFDLVCSFQVIEHIKDPDEFIDKCKMLVNAGGFIAIITPNYHNLQNIFLKIMRNKISLIDPLHFKEYTMTELKDLGNRHGLKLYDYFGRDLHLKIWRHNIINFNSRFSKILVKSIPSISDVIGIIFKYN